jgi:glycosyltransferase involved in cell wall biosynthesis
VSGLCVLLVANTLPPRDVSGVGEQVLQLAAGLREQGHRVEVLGRGPGGARGPKVLFPVTVVPAVLRAMVRGRPDVIQVHESDGGLAALAVRLARPVLGGFGGGRGRPLLVALLQVSYVEERRAVRDLIDRSSLAEGGQSRVLGRPGAVERRFRRGKARFQVILGRWSARLADLVLAPSARTAREIERDYLPADRAGTVRVVPNVTGGLAVAVDPDGDESGPDDETAPGSLLFVGRLRIRKGVEVLLEALERLGRFEAPDTAPPRLLIVGDGEHRAALETAAAERGLLDDGTVRFVGRRDAAGVRRLLAGARALVVPSTYEGMPLVILEAMEAGVPVVASAVSGIPEVVVDGETGWLVPAEEPDALATALAEALADPPEAIRRGIAGRERVMERYRPRHAAEAWLEALGTAGEATTDTREER